MTKKDYELVAKIVREGLELNRGEDYNSALWRFADNFAMEAAINNRLFARKRFLKACGFES